MQLNTSVLLEKKPLIWRKSVILSSWQWHIFTQMGLFYYLIWESVFFQIIMTKNGILSYRSVATFTLNHLTVDSGSPLICSPKIRIASN